jgi:hypothetical protein
MPRYDYFYTTEKSKIKRRRSYFLLILFLLALGFVTYFIITQKNRVILSSIKLYFFDPKKEELVPVQKDIDFRGNKERVVKVIIENLLKPPEDTDLVTYLPSYTKVKSVEISGNLCTINFFPDIVSVQLDSVVKEASAVYSIVNSVTELQEIRKVKIEIEGNTTSFFKRYIDITAPISTLTGQLPKGKDHLIYFYDLTLNNFIVEQREILDSTDINEKVKSILDQLIVGSDIKGIYYPAGDCLSYC